MPPTAVAQIDEKLTPLQTEFKALTDENDTIVAAVEVKDGAVIIDAEKQASFTKNMNRLREIRPAIENLNQQKQMIEWGHEKPEGADAAAVLAAAAGSLAAKGFWMPPGANLKTLGSAFIESETFLNFKKSGLLTMPAPFEAKGDISSGMVQVPFDPEKKDVYGALPSEGGWVGNNTFGTRQRDPIVDRAMRRNRVRDLFPVQNTTASVIEYFRVSGFTNNASTVAQRDGSAFALKPKSTLAFTSEQAPVRTIAHWEAAHREVLNDEPALRGIIDAELLYGLRLHEDDQILNGAGTGQDLEGILNVTGIQTYTMGVAPEQKADAVRKAMTKAFLSYYEPTGVVLHPNDWEDIELLKDAEDRYLLVMMVAQGAEQRLWRIPVVDTPAMDEGTALVGAFGIGATLYDREEANIRIAEQHSDFFARNAIAILAEERLALATKRPEAFVKITF